MLKKDGYLRDGEETHTVHDVGFTVFGKGIYAATQFRVIELRKSGMASGEQRPSRCLSIRRDHTHHERFKALFFYYYGQCEQYIYMGFVLFSEK